MKTSIKSGQFKSVLNNSKSLTINNLQFQYCLHGNAVGFIINKKLGSSVLRNSFKRQCRALFLLSCKKTKSFSLIVRPLVPLSAVYNVDDAFRSLEKMVFCD